MIFLDTSKVIACFLFLFHCFLTGSTFDPQWNLLVSRNCSRNVRPNHDGPPVEVGVSMYVLDISSISEEKMDFQLDLLFRQYWKDTCLLPLEKEITINTANGASIWIPDTFFVNEKNSYLHPRSPSSELLRIDSTGRVSYSKRVSMTASCHFDLHSFPMDKQMCQIDIESYGHTTEEIQYKWNFGDNSVAISDGIMLPQFKILTHKLKQMETENAEKYSRLTIEFQFKRFVGHYVMQIFLPSAFIVLISFASFWINHRFITARLTLSAITFFTMSMVASNTYETLPKVSYITAIDVYLLGCLVMVCFSVFEIIAASYMMRTTQMTNNFLNRIVTMKNKDELINSCSEKIDDGEQFSDKEALHDEDETKNVNMLPNMTDVYSRFLFPIIFILFNMIFFLYYSLFSI